MSNLYIVKSFHTRRPIRSGGHCRFAQPLFQLQDYKGKSRLKNGTTDNLVAREKRGAGALRVCNQSWIIHTCGLLSEMTSIFWLLETRRICPVME